MTGKLNKLVETYVELDSSKIVEEVLKEYGTITRNFSVVLQENQNISDGEKIPSVEVKYKGKTISFRIIDEYYTFSDLLFEVCRMLEIDYRNHKITLSTGESLNLATGVKEHMQRMLAKYKTLPFINLISTTEEPEININQFMKNVKHDKDARLEQNTEINELTKKEDEPSQTANLLTKDIRLIEMNLLEKFKRIIFYLVFLFIVYVANMSKNKIHQSNFINHAFISQIFKKPYIDILKGGLENSFSTISSFDDLKTWCYEVIPEIFYFKDGKI